MSARRLLGFPIQISGLRELLRAIKRLRLVLRSHHRTPRARPFFWKSPSSWSIADAQIIALDETAREQPPPRWMADKNWKVTNDKHGRTFEYVGKPDSASATPRYDDLTRAA